MRRKDAVLWSRRLDLCLRRVWLRQTGRPRYILFLFIERLDGVSRWPGRVKLIRYGLEPHLQSILFVGLNPFGKARNEGRKKVAVPIKLTPRLSSDAGRAGIMSEVILYEHLRPITLLAPVPGAVSLPQAIPSSSTPLIVKPDFSPLGIDETVVADPCRPRPGADVVGNLLRLANFQGTALKEGWKVANVKICVVVP